MQVGIVSDTHDNYGAAEEIARVFDDRGIDTLVHCGDFIAPPLLGAFDGHEFDIHGVIGNNDGERDGLETTLDSFSDGSQLHGREAVLTFDGTSIHVLHGDQGIDVVNDRAESGDYDYVCYGHFHVAEQRVVDGTTVVNPGAHFPTVPDENRTVAFLDTDTGETEFVNIDG
ncbi:YfcE family phosphodiesterase [Halorientalis sp.]|uniref:YfcE family phosphodiesterase n=1 Tax=Halorientalis sp. TaxID=1931229 RepID=UPI0026203640|nr:YfcE family phosphodiesterase [Halorientalis sp.]